MPSTTDSLTIIAIGNPGSGKSTTLNYLAQEDLFKSGLSYGSGMTGALDSKVANGITYSDTPGLNDAGKRKAAGKAITEALKKGGKTKILFFITTESGRAKNDDVTTMNLVLDAAPEIRSNYGIILNKIKPKQAKDLKCSKIWAQLLASVFAGSKTKTPCGPVSVQGVPINDDADDTNDYLVPKGELTTLEGHPLENFVFSGLVPIIDLTPNKAGDVDTSSYEQKQEEMIKLMKEAVADKEKLKELQKEVEKARDEQGPCQMILGGVGKGVDNVLGAPKEFYKAVVELTVKVVEASRH